MDEVQDLAAEEGVLREVLSSVEPSFDKRVEDGTQFLMYKLGSLEVRAVRGLTGELEIGAVLAPGGAATSAKAAEGGEADGARVAGVALRVERTTSGSCQYFVSLETADGRSIVAEGGEDDQWLLPVFCLPRDC